jgi:M6 family metalloprotease-like protein/MYXO-CTERM domain-containing protein
MIRIRGGRRLAQSLVIAGLLLGSSSALGYPHRGEHMIMTQPDGTSVEVVVWGDEFYARVESLDGYTLVLDPVTHWICYATSTQAGDLVSTGIQFTGDQSTTTGGLQTARTKPAAESELRRRGIGRGLRHAPDKIEQKIRASQQQLWGGAAPPAGAAGSSGNAPASAPPEPGLLGATGSIKGLVVAIDFSDRVGTISSTELDNAFNGATYGDSRGSIRTWAETISYSMFTVSHQIVAYMRAAYPTSHYQYGTDYAASDELMKEVFAYIENNVDLTPLGVNGALPSLAVLYAGAVISNGWATSLWPHSGCGRFTTSEGVAIRQCYLSNLGTSTPLRLGTHRHELGHALFQWPDTYDYDDDSKSAGGFAMEEDLPCAPFRMWAGWMKVIDVSNANQVYSLAANGDTCLRYNNPGDSQEYFIIEYLKKEGWNAAAPDQGLLVWHIDDNKNRSNNSWQDMTPTRHYRLSVEQADGQFHLEHNTKAGDGDLFHSGDKTRFDATTTPSSNWWAGSASNLTLCDIGGLNASMSVNVGCAGGGSGGSAATGGASTTGGSATGGRAVGGTSSGGKATGGQATGGASTGGRPTGGQPSGGTSSGGSGVTASGGSLGTGGSSPSTGGLSPNGGSTVTGGTSATAGSGGAGGTGGGTEQNCNCSVPGSEQRSPWMFLPLLGLLAMRRRRRSR